VAPGFTIETYRHLVLFIARMLLRRPAENKWMWRWINATVYTVVCRSAKIVAPSTLAKDSAPVNSYCNPRHRHHSHRHDDTHHQTHHPSLLIHTAAAKSLRAMTHCDRRSCFHMPLSFNIGMKSLRLHNAHRRITLTTDFWDVFWIFLFMYGVVWKRKTLLFKYNFKFCLKISFEFGLHI